MVPRSRHHGKRWRAAGTVPHFSNCAPSGSTASNHPNPAAVGGEQVQLRFNVAYSTKSGEPFLVVTDQVIHTRQLVRSQSFRVYTYFLSFRVRDRNPSYSLSASLDNDSDR